MKKIEKDTGIQFIPKFVKQTSDLWYGDIVTHENYNAKLNLNTEQGDYNTEFLRLLLTIADGENTPHVLYLDNYINEIIDELDTKANNSDLATVAKSGSYTDLSNTPTKLSSFENDTNYVDTEELNNNLTNLSRELVMLLQDINKDIATVEDTANTAIDNAATADNKAEEALTLAQSYSSIIANKQNQLTAGSNISIIGDVISATDTTYIAGDNVTIVDNVISSTDTKYTAGANIIIDENNVISSIGGGGGSGVSYIAGDNITIEGNVISAIDTDTTYTAGDGINIENNIISSKPWFFTCSKGAADSINLTTATDVAEMYTKIINYYLKYAEIPQVYWYNGKLMQDRPAPYGTYLYCLKGLYISGGSSTYTTVSFHWESADSNFSNSTAKYGLKYFYQYEKYINTTVQFNRSELEAGEVNTLPTSHSRFKYTPYFLDSSEAAKIITTTNTTEFIPTGDYQPATKKYVDTAVANASGTEYTAGENISISEDNVISAIIKTYSNRIMSDIGATTYVQSDTATTMLQVLDNLENPTKWSKVNSNSIIVHDGDNQITVTPAIAYTHLKDTAYSRTVYNYNADNTLQTIVENLSEEAGPVYTLVDKANNIAMLTPTSLSIAGEDVLDRFHNTGLNIQTLIGQTENNEQCIETHGENGLQYKLLSSDYGFTRQVNDGTDWTDVTTVGTLGVNKKNQLGLNDSGNMYLRGELANGTQYQLNMHPDYLRFQKYEGGSWSNIWQIFDANLATSGYQKFANGFMVQWQRIQAQAGGTAWEGTSVYYSDHAMGNWSVPFKSLYAILPNAYSSNYWATVSGATATSAGTVRCFRPNSSKSNITINVVAIGTWK